MLTLALDAALSVGSVAVLDGTRLVTEHETPMRDASRERLLPTVVDALGAAMAGPSDVDRIVCGEGPGSFTSLRIAASIAKGLAVGRGVPLLGVPSLLLSIAGSPDWNPGRYLSVLDAMRGESFAACYEVLPDEDVEEVAPPAIVATAALPSAAAHFGARLLGPGQPLDARPRAAGVSRLGAWLARATEVDVTSWEPLYGRLAEAQVRWEAAHGRPLGAR